MMASMSTSTEAKLPPYSNDTDRWAAVGRDRSANGVFYYAVRTTGVYCRPACAARLARRESVQFYATPDEAEQAGFRPCQRCRPAEPALAEEHALAVARACTLIEQADELPSLDTLAAAAGMSRYHFHRAFKAVAGLTPKAYVAAHHAGRVRDELSRTSTVTEAIYAAGSNSNGRFYETCSEVLGMNPTTFRTGGVGAAIRFAIGECSLGSILVAATEQGVYAIQIGDDPDVLARDLQDRFPNAQLLGGDAAFEQVVARVAGSVEAPAHGLDLPLDTRGTAFQQRVWQALREIPAGATASYADVAARTGAPNATHAVACACAANPLAIAIPCHRVVRSDGALSGYRWGVEHKRVLLAREAAS